MDNPVLQAMYRKDFDPSWTDGDGNPMGDPWGTAMSLWFDICDWLTVQGVSVPAHWEYRPSPFLPHSIEEHKATWESEVPPSAFEETSTEELIHMGNVLERYTRMLDKAGHSY